MERLYDYCVSYTSGSIGKKYLTQPLPPLSDRENIHMESIGLEVSIMPNNQRPQDFATLTTVSWLSCNYLRPTKESCILT